MKRKELIAEWRKKPVSALRAELKEIRFKEGAKLSRARILTILKEKQIAANE